MFDVHHDVAALTTVHPHVKFQSAAFCLFADNGGNGVEYVVFFFCGADGNDLSGVYAAGLKDFLDEAKEIVTGGQDFFQVILNGIGESFFLSGQLGETEDNGHRGAHIMGHMG
jgi:hypothetical protein